MMLGGMKVRQIKNYLSRISDIKTVLLIEGKNGQEGELAGYLLKEKRVQRIYVVAEQPTALYQNEKITFFTLDAAQNHCFRVNAVIVGRGCQGIYKKLKVENADFLIAALDKGEDYFSLWEQGRECFQYIYLERDKEKKPKDRDAEDCEILEWERGDSGIELSIVIPVYNVATYLPECIESLIKWDAPYVEFLFVNDGSTDNSGEIIESYRKKDNRIHLMNKTNGGCASARNYGISHARGRYLGFVDSDDFVDSGMFRKLLERALMGNFELCYCGYREFYEETGDSEPVLNDCLAEPYVSGTYREDKVQKLAINTRVAIWRCIYKRSLLEREHLCFHEDLKRFDDLPFRIECIFSAKSAVCVPEYLYYYRLGRKGQDVSCKDERLWVHFRIFEYLDDFVEPMRDRRLLDYLQIVKVNTHGYALAGIERPLYHKYRREAARQLDKYAGTLRTLCLLMLYGGRGHIGWYLRRKI